MNRTYNRPQALSLGSAETIKKLVTQKGSLVQRELAAKLTEGLFYEMFGIISYVMQIRNVSFTTPPSKIRDFFHLPLHRGGFGWFFDRLSRPQAYRLGPAAFYGACVTYSFVISAPS